MEESSSDESEEDFAFLDQDLKDNKQLDEVSQRLLAGIIQAPPKDKKRFDKLTKEEIWERRRAKARERGENSDEYDDELGSGELGTIENRYASDAIDHGVVQAARNKKRKTRSNKVGSHDNTAETSDGGHPPCPEGYDPAKWAKLSLEEKCKYLGIDVNEWLKMNREQQMQRMHNMANNFNYYAMDKTAPDDKFSGRKKWHI